VIRHISKLRPSARHLSAVLRYVCLSLPEAQSQIGQPVSQEDLSGESFTIRRMWTF
jgi:hypothetical protein